MLISLLSSGNTKNSQANKFIVLPRYNNGYHRKSQYPIVELLIKLKKLSNYDVMTRQFELQTQFFLFLNKNLFLSPDCRKCQYCRKWPTSPIILEKKNWVIYWASLEYDFFKTWTKMFEMTQAEFKLKRSRGLNIGKVND